LIIFTKALVAQAFFRKIKSTLEEKKLSSLGPSNVHLTNEDLASKASRNINSKPTLGRKECSILFETLRTFEG